MMCVSKGSAWLLAAFNAGTMTGPAALVSWVIGAMLVLFLVLVLAIFRLASNYIPGLLSANHTLTFPAGYMVAAALLVLFAGVNLLGVRLLTACLRSRSTCWPCDGDCPAGRRAPTSAS
jgi:amino acid transporter